MKTKRIAPRVYEVVVNGDVYHIDGQNHQHDSREWQVFLVAPTENEWCETYPTKRDALEHLLSPLHFRENN